MESAPRKMGRVGSHAAVGRAVLRSQHLQQPQAGVHLQREPSPGAAAGVPQPDGTRYIEILRVRYISNLRILVW